MSIKTWRALAEEGDTVWLRTEVVMIEDTVFDVRVVVYKEEAA